MGNSEHRIVLDDFVSTLEHELHAAEIAESGPATLGIQLSVVFLLRLAEQRFCGSMFQEPPRTARLVQSPVVRRRPSSPAKIIRPSTVAFESS